MTGDERRGAAVVAFESGGGGRASCPFVFVHGAGADASRFRPLAAELANAVAVDLPGHGAAGGAPRARIDGPAGYAHAVADLLRREGYERPLLVGHSMGAAIALAVALDEAVALGGVGVVGGGARLRVHPDFLAAMAQGRVPDGLSALMFAREAPSALVAAEDGELARAAASGALHADFAACDAFDVENRLSELRLPAAVVVGSQDRMTPPRLSERLATGWGDPDAVEATVVDGAGHYAQLERPSAVARALLRLRERALAAGPS